jgi:hypothetical protein
MTFGVIEDEICKTNSEAFLSFFMCFFCYNKIGERQSITLINTRCYLKKVYANMMHVKCMLIRGWLSCYLDGVQVII